MKESWQYTNYTCEFMMPILEFRVCYLSYIYYMYTFYQAVVGSAEIIKKEKGTVCFGTKEVQGLVQHCPIEI